ncbi:class I SAM-dependent methyltransferase [Candidatus Sumerlaeota bacterium]|nr:class I SAM-dependent methyltransferase [Candidatus Sumerlaeota bacterium]
MVSIQAGKYEHSSYEQHRSRIISDLIPDNSKGEVALDIGSGPGFFTRILTEKGWNAHVVDVDEGNLEEAQKFASRTFHGDAVNILQNLPDNSYDFILSLEIIEHLDKNNGRKLLYHIHRILKPGGALLISTPNRFSPEGWIGGFASILSGKKKAWNAWDSSHVHIYSSMELIGLLKKSGFRIDHVTGFWFGARISRKIQFPSILTQSSMFPWNRMGFNVIVRCLKND